MKKISIIFGTRPEAIKLCPLVLALGKHSDLIPHVCVTGQHRQMLTQALDDFGVVPDVDLSLMEPNQTLAGLTSRAIVKIDSYLRKHQPDMVIVQGDTTTVFSAAMAAFYQQIPVGHLEAGLRTWNKLSPFPEEINRVLTSHIADLHFAPTQISRNNLLKEGVSDNKIFITGNTVIDALHIAVDKVEKKAPLVDGLPEHIMNGPLQKTLVLITGHRRENHGQSFIDICSAISTLAKKFHETIFVYPVHLNPNVREPVFRLLNGIDNVYLIEPQSYLSFIALMNRAKLILTDSGGVQEEAPSLGKPVLVMRGTTERPEAVNAGTVKLVGTDRRDIIDNVSLLLSDKKVYNSMANAINPYGDGKACDRILTACLSFFNT
jgi:UDP-N-acetylglucosamine 2-epimerase (non-hydrolysing)